jgi:Protein of unknown function (DUF3667)
MAGHTGAMSSNCQNCGTPLHGPFCSACGQHDVDYHRSLWPILEDSLEGFLHVDGKFFRTVRCLFTRPGFLTKEFNGGRRVAYTQPLRLYIFASLLFFTAGLIFTHPSTQAEIAQAKPDAAERQQERSEKSAAATPRIESIIQPAAPSAPTGIFESLNHEDPKEVTREVQHLFPTMGFFCLPFLATLLLAAYPRSGHVYVEHFVFALHLQAFYFIAALVKDVAKAVAGLIYAPLAAFVSFLFFLAVVWSAYRAFRVVYGQGRWRTIFKMIFVSFAYAVILIIGITVTGFAAALLVL